MRSNARTGIFEDPFASIGIDQDLLLDSALLPNEAAISAWREWISRVDVDRLDLASRRLLPLVYVNLNSQGFSDPLLKKCKGVMRLVWTQNQIRLAKAKAMMRTLQKAGIPVMLLKGIALASCYYPHLGLRAMGDVDILVPGKTAAFAVALLERAGWKPIYDPGYPLTGDFFSVYHAVAFENGAGDILDLHWHVMEECVYPGADDDFWEKALRLDLDGIPLRVLNPADQILHVCTHAVRHGLERVGLHAIGWVADAIMILNSRSGEIDFPRLLEQAQKRRLVLALRQALSFLQRRFSVKLPGEFCRELEGLPVTDLEVREFRTRSRQQRLSGYFPARWCQYLRQKERRDASFRLSQLLGFAEFLRRYYGLRHRGQLPWAISARAWKRLVKAVSGPTP